MMSDQKQIAASPDLYIRTPKTIILAFIKLLEAFFAGYMVYLLLDNDAALKVAENIQIIITRGLMGTEIEGSMVGVLFARLLKSLEIVTKEKDLADLLKWILVIAFGLTSLGGLASCSLVVTKRGAGVVYFVHAARLALAVLAMIWAFYDVGDTIVRMSKDSSELSKYYNNLNIFQFYGYLSFFAFAEYVIVYIATPIVLIVYHANILKVFSRVRQEAPANRMMSGAYHNVPRAAGVIACVYVFAVLFAVIHMVGNGTELLDFVSYLGSINFLFTGKKFIYLAIPLVLAIKYILVALCSKDFDTAHYRANHGG